MSLGAWNSELLRYREIVDLSSFILSERDQKRPIQKFKFLLDKLITDCELTCAAIAENSTRPIYGILELFNNSVDTKIIELEIDSAKLFFEKSISEVEKADKSDFTCSLSHASKVDETYSYLNKINAIEGIDYICIKSEIYLYNKKPVLFNKMKDYFNLL